MTAQTLVSAIEDLPKRPGRGFRFIASDNQEHFFLYAELEAEAKRRAAHLAAVGLRKGDRLAMVVPEGHEFVLSFLGAVFAGAVPVPIFPRATFKAIESYADTVTHIAKASGARMLLTSESTKPYVEGVLARDTQLEKMLLTETVFTGETPAFTAPPTAPEDLCFLQFTSGSTSQPKGVMVSHKNLVANASAFLGPHGLDRRDSDVGVSWLPLFHDMGLIGFILGTLICDIPVVILPTSTFARGPRIWLETIHKHRGTLTYAPNFAYALATKRLKDRDLESLDLSCLRLAGCGAEPIHADTMREFAARLAPAGFGANALLPSYGMAESTLAISFHQRGTPIITDRVDAEALARNEATPATASSTKVLEFVSCGVPFPGHELAIVDEEGKPVGERRVGEIVTRGPSVSAGYFQNAEATAAGFKDGWLHTGDLGYQAGGNLYICGRLKDLIIIRGANFHAQDIEWAISDLPGVRRGNVVAFSVLRDNEEQLILAAEGNSGDAAQVREGIKAKVAEAFGLQVSEVVVSPVGSLPKTSSGKAQRRKTKQLYERGELLAHPVNEHDVK